MTESKISKLDIIHSISKEEFSEKIPYIQRSANNILTDFMNEDFSDIGLDMTDIIGDFRSEIFSEIEWYQSNNDNLIASISIDNCDNDYNAIVFKADENDQYIPLEHKVSIDSVFSARKWIEGVINKQIDNELKDKKAHNKPEVITETKNNNHKKIELFKLLVPENKLNPSLEKIINNKGYSPAVELLKDITSNLYDRDGNFAKDFQTTGFDARVWEIYLDCYLKEEKFDIDYSEDVPDFICSKSGESLAIEAVTVGRNHNPRELDQFISEIQNKTEKYSLDSMALRFGSPLFSKLNKKYYNQDVVKGKPLIFAISDFYEHFSMAITHASIINYLYATEDIPTFDSKGKLIIESKEIVSHKKGSKDIPSGFFSQPGAENISGILFSNNGTISKFNRIGLANGFGDKSLAIKQIGDMYNDNPNAIKPKRFTRNISFGDKPELWAEGMNLYHNPKANIPISSELFKNTAQHYFKDSKVISYLPEFHPITSLSIIIPPSRKSL